MPPPVERAKETDSLNKKGIVVSNCMLEQTMGTVVGVASGLAWGVTTKRIKPFILLSTAGTAADLLFGYTHACTDVIDDYFKATKAEKALKASSKDQASTPGR